MALSIGGLSAYGGISSVRPMNYAIENQANFSSAYTESVKKSGAAAGANVVGATNPVQYPNAMATQVDSTAQVQKSVEVNRQMNAVAAEFATQSVGYSSNSSAYGYEMVGSTLDLYA